MKSDINAVVGMTLL